MALDKVALPQTTPTSASDWTAAVAQLTATRKAEGGANPVDLANGLIPAGAVISLGGVFYYGTSSTTISGTPSKYVKITPSGDTLTATAAYVANLTGVTWNAANSGYYDGSGNLYLFDEAQAIVEGVLSVPKTLIAAMMTASKILESLKTVDSNTSGLNSQYLQGLSPGNGSGNVPINNGTLNTNLNADLLDGLNSGNSSGNIPINNGTLNTNLNAHRLNGRVAEFVPSGGDIPIARDGSLCEISTFRNSHVLSSISRGGIYNIFSSNGYLPAGFSCQISGGIKNNTSSESYIVCAVSRHSSSAIYYMKCYNMSTGVYAEIELTSGADGSYSGFICI